VRGHRAARTHRPRRRDHERRLPDALDHRGNHRPPERRHQRDRREHRRHHRHHRHHRGNHRRHHRYGHRVHRGHRRQGRLDHHQGRRERLPPRWGALDGLDLFRGWAAGAASCRDSVAVRRCRVGRCGSGLGGYSHLGGEACCWARLDSRAVRVVAPTNAAALSCRRRRDCCLPAVTADPASATGDDRPQDPQAVHPGADRRAAVGGPLDVAPPGAGVPPAGSARPWAARRPGARHLSGAPLGSHAGEVRAQMPPETLLVRLGEPPGKMCPPVDGRAPVQDRAWQRFHRLRVTSRQRVRGRWSMRHWRGPAFPHLRETSREACGRPVPPPLRRRTSHTRRDRRVS
jgi:hypothetical protein